MLGARVFEKHFTDENNRVGPDHKFSMNPDTWRQMICACKELREALGDGVKKIEENEQATVSIQRRAFYLQNDLKKGDLIRAEDIYPLRPVKEGAVLPFEKNKIVGKRLVTDKQKDKCLYWKDVEDAER